MRKNRGFRVKHKLAKVFKWVFRRQSNSTNHQRFNSSSRTRKALSKLCNWGRSLKRQAKGLCFLIKSDLRYVRMDHDPVETKSAGDPPKGHLAVYVGESDDDTQRYVVPVIYFNHPLFGELLKEAENVFGFNHHGGIQIPCRVSHFENVQTRIAAGESFRRRPGILKHVYWIRDNQH